MRPSTSKALVTQSCVWNMSHSTNTPLWQQRWRSCSELWPVPHCPAKWWEQRGQQGRILNAKTWNKALAQVMVTETQMREISPGKGSRTHFTDVVNKQRRRLKRTPAACLGLTNSEIQHIGWGSWVHWGTWWREMKAQLHMGRKKRFSFGDDYKQHREITGHIWPKESVSDICV